MSLGHWYVWWCDETKMHCAIRDDLILRAKQWHTLQMMIWAQGPL